ncbi:23S rRNA (guanosine(2251)-2'-O)-methyltransferase RlmB [Candidatus Margulisiibacteriota bacterium]
MQIDLNSLLSYAANQDQPLLLLLDGLEDPRNFGAILRTAEAVGVSGVIIPKRRSVGITDTVQKTSTGASDLVRIAQVSNLTQSISRLKDEGYWIVGMEASGNSLYTEVDYRGPIALVIGSEGNGISRLVKENCDFLVRIPMFGEISSLNASVAAAILMYETVRQRNEQ